VKPVVTARIPSHACCPLVASATKLASGPRHRGVWTYDGVIIKAEYGYNAVGNRTSLTDRRGAQAFGYDNLDRLTSASHPLLATPQVFAYDPVGNRTAGGSVVNAGNQLTADATHSYQYDDNGDLTRKTFLATGNFTSTRMTPRIG
jgi:YD repeat-containing protein